VTANQRIYVQARYSGGSRWIAVAVSASRAAATALARDAYENIPDEHGQTPKQVRLVGALQLTIEGGAEAVATADADISERAQQTQ
jgi:hypothetical protein